MFTKKEEMKWRCPHCGERQLNEVYVRLSVREEPASLNRILDTSLFKVTCQNCGHEEYYTGPLLYVDEDRKLMIAMGDVHDFAKEKDAYLALGYAVRQVPEIVDLCEKVLISENGRDDRIIELMKAANAVLLKGQQYDQMLYAPDEDNIYFELIKDAGSIGRIPFMEAVYDDMKERFAADLMNECDDETVIDLSWALDFFEKHYQAAV
jgi:predicted nucleic-acid-binding Zn-ribbon protein